MKILPINNNNRHNFDAKLKISGLFGIIPRNVEEELPRLTKKAEKIGLKDDVIEINYGRINEVREDYICHQDNFYLSNWRRETTQNYSARFIQEGKEKTDEKRKGKYLIDYSSDNWQKQDVDLADDYLDHLYEKYPNDIWE